METKEILAVDLKVGDIVRDVINPERATTLKVEKIEQETVFMSLVTEGALVQNKYEYDRDNLIRFDRYSILDWHILTK